ncbi:dolichol-phosphate mannosyltransferase subunit 3 [Athalia rosae]|uniref:dolichol-phosphate mannosyltransferase subunit 3 n=1 Tax=Athalia rosae TaxID=37344 RepID=UPI002034358E|nr:dolichol-phosphate mannosyltransferase subunit 3 [Athalia rosae]XP_020711843.2 dolichol-phosphate mannosyltransferase subunit 3 [Athalia rosae]XP_048509907.1 dolichol-phosphate mannosyltransferase subunit 3 [Athalia rosae]
MTKLMEWAFVATVFFSIWTATITGSIQSPLIEKWRTTILYLPVILIILFGFYAASVVLYRVFTFNNCEEAAAELQEEIKEAKKDLRSKGLLLRED